MEETIRELHEAVAAGNEDRVRQLLDEGLVNPDDPDWDHNGRLAIIEASRLGHLNIVQVLCKAGCDINAGNAVGETALHVVAKSKNVNIPLAKALLEVEFLDSNRQEKMNGYSPLHLFLKNCVCNGKFTPEMEEIIQLLVAKSDLTIKDHRGETALHRAACGKGHHRRPLEILVNAGADLDVQNDLGLTPLMCAVDTGSTEMASVLIDSGTDTNLSDRNGQTALHYAAYKNLSDLVKSLLQHGCNVNSPDINGDSALHLASSKGNTNAVQALLSSTGVDINAQNIKGNTPLHNAVESGFTTVVHMLLDANCDVTAETTNKKTALDVAQARYISRCRPEICELLKTALQMTSDRHLNDDSRL
ncbi:26S proteasome non-ATPase regulatory subunit 10-like [Limulus polyphemus]|uniref:26S proteasome non-ATPase regulatory subunit 10-like n=1 Tax=Limulus polyphemus TaxID=6850 RepID=A0ABM1BYZ6_LIMPO|nr:26S proteasome non-ATPase regulatory subunit 10-like [Limulus polyphemus]